MRNRKIRGYSILSAAIAIIILIFSASSSNAAENKVRIGYFLMSGYQEKTEDGNRWGYGYDYLQEIARYTGWEYEFVDAARDECLDMLAKGELDIVTCVEPSAEGTEIFDYSKYQMGVSCSILTVETDNDNYFYNDFAGYTGMKVGMINGSSTNKVFPQLCEEYNADVDSTIYSTEAEAKEALFNKEVDAIVSSGQRVLENEKIIARFNYGPFYCVSQKGNTELMEELNKAMEEIVMSNPYFESQLYDKYFGINSGYKIALTAEEKEYIEKHRKIRVTASPNTEPMCYYDGVEYTGIFIDDMRTIAEEVGLEIEYVETDSYKESVELLRTGQVDAIADFYTDYSWGERNDVILTNPYMDLQYVEISSKGELPPADEIRVATCENLFFNTMYILKNYTKDNLVYYGTKRECVDAVRNGEADIAFLNQYTAQKWLGEDENLKLNGNNLYGVGHGVSVAVSKNNRMLCHILDKALFNLESTEIEQIAEQYTSEGASEVSLISYVYYNPFEFTLILCVFLFIVILVLLYVIFVKRKYNRHIFELAYQDNLTGLNNIFRFEDLIEKRWLEYRGRDIFIISLDISHFSTINETYGRGVGDQVICYVGQKLRELYGEEGIVARSKVDNFLVNGTYGKEEEIAQLLRLIQEEISVFRHGENDIYINYNFGIAMESCTAGTSVKKMIDRAEMARKAAKKETPHLRYFNDDMEEQLMREKMIEDSMKKALRNEEFVVYYQPKYQMSNNEIMGAEALVRWNSSEYGFMSPAEFIPIFENNGFIVELDFYVMEEVYKMLRRRLDNNERVVRISINQSRIHFAQNNYIERLNALRSKYRIPKQLIELELTESIFANMQDISSVVANLKKNEYYLSVDDFGTGYSSLNMLKEVPIDTLKIDKDFLNDEDNSGRYQKVIRKVVELAKDLNMDIICEGVERSEQAEFLQSVGCMYAQGFLYAKPMPADNFLELLN